MQLFRDLSEVDLDAFIEAVESHMADMVEAGHIAALSAAGRFSVYRAVRTAIVQEWERARGTSVST